ncbi:glycosyltransferase family 9 protein [Streptomyces iconiensis]|uniref:Glycosyltransferase family 9 protein n=1 Tax=Streptomyces iconiensis TaxID=1384038 RepID=A0ABT6ZUU2_9ACTN|nr:glycosyltransferase family 9 protein [Streptomyces iconiensis]MDJ1132832.1 glycosyltransferase family 9 protein [Streptomyces iconiensis]
MPVRTPVPQRPDPAYGPARLLVLRALGLGDLLTGVPALRALRRAFPGHETVLAAPAALAPVVRLTGAVDTLLPAEAQDRGVPARLPWEGTPPDLAVDLHGSSAESHRPLLALRPGRTLGFADPETPEVAGPPWYAEEHERDRWCRLLEAYGIHADAGDLLLERPSTPSPAPGAVVVHPGAGAPSRRWPPDRYVAVTRALLRAGHRVAVTADPGEARLAREIAEAAGVAPEDDFGGRLGLGELTALVGEASAVLSGDTGPAHLAVACATPSVTLFGPVAPRLWGPPPGGRHAALWHEGPPGDPHGPYPDPRLLRIEPREVLDALARLPEVQPS